LGMVTVATGSASSCAKHLYRYLAKERVQQLPPVVMAPPSWTKPKAITVKWAEVKAWKFEVESWVDVWRTICLWLASDGILKEASIKTANGRYIVSSSSRPFIEPERIAPGFWTEKQKGKAEIWSDAHFLLHKYLSDDATLEADWVRL